MSCFIQSILEKRFDEVSNHVLLEFLGYRDLTAGLNDWDHQLSNGYLEPTWARALAVLWPQDFPALASVKYFSFDPVDLSRYSYPYLEWRKTEVGGWPVGLVTKRDNWRRRVDVSDSLEKGVAEAKRGLATRQQASMAGCKGLYLIEAPNKYSLIEPL